MICSNCSFRHCWPFLVYPPTFLRRFVYLVIATRSSRKNNFVIPSLRGGGDYLIPGLFTSIAFTTLRCVISMNLLVGDTLNYEEFVANHKKICLMI